MRKKIKIQKFKDENKERDFWGKFNLAKNFEPSDFKRISFPTLKPSSQPISLRLPSHILARVKERANEIDMPYQSLIKKYIAQGILKEDSN